MNGGERVPEGSKETNKRYYLIRKYQGGGGIIFLLCNFLAISFKGCSLLSMRWLVKCTISCFQNYKPALCASAIS